MSGYTVTDTMTINFISTHRQNLDINLNYLLSCTYWQLLYWYYYCTNLHPTCNSGKVDRQSLMDRWTDGRTAWMMTIGLEPKRGYFSQSICRHLVIVGKPPTPPPTARVDIQHVRVPVPLKQFLKLKRVCNSPHPECYAFLCIKTYNVNSDGRHICNWT